MSAVLQTPSERLERSREQLRLALKDMAPAAGPASGHSAAAAAGPPQWFARLRALPGAGLLAEAVELWWARHPLRVAATVAAQTATLALRPMAQRHPLRLVLGAAVLGGLVAWSRPWRWVVVPALFAGLLPQLVSAGLRASQPAAAPPPPMP